MTAVGQSNSLVKLSNVLALRTLSEEAKGLIGRMARIMVILLAILKGLWVLWERLDYEMGEEAWDLFGQC